MKRPGEPLNARRYKCFEPKKGMEATISMLRIQKFAIAHSFHSSLSHTSHLLRSAGVALLTIGLFAVSGCSSGSSVSDIKVLPGHLQRREWNAT